MAGMTKKAIYFTLDAFFATILIGLALVLISQTYISEVQQPQITYYSQDVVNCLSTIKITELNNSYVDSLISSGDIINLNNSVIEQIGEFYVLNKTDLAENLSRIVSESLIPEKFGFEILVNDETLFIDNTVPTTTDLVSTKRLISGIEKFKPLRGATSKVFLEGIKSKKYSSFLYFGGFVGQGNISGFIDDMPSNANISKIYLELDANSDFSFYINGIQCGGVFGVGTGSMTADAWDITYCNDSISEGAMNNFTIIFTGSLNDAYVGGGFVQVDYYTDEMQQEPEESIMIESLSDIGGIINLYSSFYVPGSLTNISVYLHYFVDTTNQTNNTFYFSVGNSTVYSDSNLSGEKNYTVTAQNISQFMSLASLDQKTVPIRAGFENVSFGFIYEGNADVALITDVSGSMDWRMDSDSTFGAVARNCDDASFNDSTTTRLSVAKCLDKQFALDILNITGNKVGLVSYDDVTHASEAVYPIQDYAVLNQTIGTAVPETGYEGSGGTCICCGINSARDILVQNLSTVTLIASGTTWYYNNFSLQDTPGQDPGGNEWYAYVYSNETQWHTGDTILGATNGYSYSPAVDTEIGSSLVAGVNFVDLTELTADAGTPEVEFSSGLNQTGNTWGTAGAYDGWDSDYGLFGRNGNDIEINFDPNEDSDQSDNTVATQQYIRILAGTNWEDSDGDCTMAGGVGIEINFTQEMYDMLSTPNGKSELSFDWYFDRYGGIDNQEAAWIKVQFGQDGSMNYLGSNIDGTNTPNDASNEIFYCENDVGSYSCPGLISNTSSYDISSLITGPGSYYVIFGAAVDEYGDNDCDENFEFRFDDIRLSVFNETDHYFFRKHFTITDLEQVQMGILNVLSDDYASVYLNGELIDLDLIEHEGRRWNRIGKNIPGNNFFLGDNVIAVHLVNTEQAAKFDLELKGINESRGKAMMVMTDGQANDECSEQGTTGDLDGDGSSDTASDDAIQAACDARQDYGIIVYAVGFSDSADEPTLQGISLCGDGLYRKSNNVSALQEFYQDVASTIISASRHSQIIEVEGEGNIASSILYGDSYIRTEYVPITEPPQFGEISLIVQEKNFDNCTFNLYIPPDIRVADAKMTSYSSEHWTDGLIVNGNQVYNLSWYSDDYTPLGDPFLVNIPVTSLLPGNNSFYIRTGDSPENSTECSINNSIIYTAQFEASVSYSDVLEKAEGCTWTIEFEDGGNKTINVPQLYSGPKTCYYTNASISYDANDTYDDAMYNLMDNLDFDDDGRIYINMDENDLVIGAISVGMIPYPWGPAIAEVRVWR
ncbi:hypothetical protein JXC34_04840 [Candidatus Woesearchaeota archaeon]|nr:hypothetical protein [Candidatus Woesearchaeota archaeon]